MTYLRALWFTRAPFVAVTCAALAYYFSSGDSQFRTGYAFTDMGVPLYSLTLIAPVMACWAAYVGGALDPFLSRPKTSRRSMLRVSTLVALGVALVVGSSLAVMALTVHPRITLQLFARGVVPFAAGAVLAVAIGLCLGFAFTRFVSMPLATALAWIWFAIPQITWWTGGRASNVTTTFAICCTRLQEPSNIALTLSLITSLLALGLFVISLTSRLRTGEGRRLRGWIIALLAPALVLIPALVVPEAEDDIVAQPRQGTTVCRAFGEVRACVWPEVVSGLSEFGEAATALSAAASESGLAAPAVWSESAADGGVTLEWNPETPAPLRPSVVALALVQWWRCDAAEVESLVANLSRPRPEIDRETAEIITGICDAASP